LKYFCQQYCDLIRARHNFTTFCSIIAEARQLFTPLPSDVTRWRRYQWLVWG